MGLRLVPSVTSLPALSISTHSKLMMSPGFPLPISISRKLINQLFLKGYFRLPRTFTSLQVILPSFRHLGLHNLKHNCWQIFARWIYFGIGRQDTIQHQGEHPKSRTWSKRNRIFFIKNELHHNWIRFSRTIFIRRKFLSLCQEQWPCSCRLLKTSWNF